MGALLDLLLDLGIRDVNLNFFRPIGRGSRHPDWVIAPESVRQIVSAVCTQRGLEPPLAKLMRPFGCHCGVGRYLNILPNGDVYPCHVLTGPRFRCGNIREQNLTDVCESAGLLTRLAAMDFAELARGDVEIGRVLGQERCLGVVHDATRAASAWEKLFPIIGA